MGFNVFLWDNCVLSMYNLEQCLFWPVTGSDYVLTSWKVSLWRTFIVVNVQPRTVLVLASDSSDYVLTSWKVSLWRTFIAPVCLLCSPTKSRWRRSISRVDLLPEVRRMLEIWVRAGDSFFVLDFRKQSLVLSKRWIIFVKHSWE